MRTDIKWETLLRYRLIEIVALWEGRLTTNHLCATFGIQRQQASRDINNYQALTDNNLEYDAKLRGYRPSKSFKPRFSEGTADEYLQTLDQSEMLQRLVRETGMPQTPTLILRPPARPVAAEVVRALVNACRNRLRTELVYASRSTPEGERRIIVPHSIVHDGRRWHVRAWCEKREQYRDFVIGRVLSVENTLGRSDKDGSDDDLWHETVDIVLAPNPELPPALQAFHARDWGMPDSGLRITTRKATVQYMLNLLGIQDQQEAHPEIIVANREALRPLLFS